MTTVALVCACNALADMTEKAWCAARDTVRCFLDGKTPVLADVRAIEDEVDRMQGEIMDYLVRLTRRELTEEQAGAIPTLMHCVNDAERISDLAYLLAKRTVAQPPATTRFSGSALGDLGGLVEKSCTLADLTLEGLRGQKGHAKAAALVLKDFKALADHAIQQHVDRLQKSACTPERGMLYVEAIASLENICRHLENIAQRADEILADT